MIALHKKSLSFPAKVVVHDPEVIFKQKYEVSDEMSFYAETVEGKFYRIIPSSMREIDFFTTLQKYVEIFAPAKGNGVIVKADVIDQIDPPHVNLR